MKNIFIPLIAAAAISILLISCSDQVEPKTELKEIYSLNCIIRGDTTTQIATISKSYNVDGYDPKTNTVDPFIQGAKIKLYYYYGSQEYVFRDTTIARSSTDKYKTPLHYYYVKNFQPTTNAKISIEATLPNGKVLTAQTETFYLSRYSVTLNSPLIPSDLDNGNLNFKWSEPSKAQSLYYVPELIIVYSLGSEANKIKYQKKVPVYFLNSESGIIPYYPSIQANIYNISFMQVYIEQSLAEISANDPVKENYTIEKAMFRLMIMDKNLAVYYASQKTFLDEFSVRVTQPDFTNIVGGLGVFGAYNSVLIDIPFKKDFINKFGYKTP